MTIRRKVSEERLRRSERIPVYRNSACSEPGALILTAAGRPLETDMEHGLRHFYTATKIRTRNQTDVIFLKIWVFLLHASIKHGRMLLRSDISRRPRAPDQRGTFSPPLTSPSPPRPLIPAFVLVFSAPLHVLQLLSSNPPPPQ